MVFQALFLLVYDILLRRETFFNYNRIYLLLTSALSITFPFIKINKLQPTYLSEPVIRLPEVFIGAKNPIHEDVLTKQAGLIIEQPETPLWQIIIITGMGVTALLFLLKIGKLLWLQKKSEKRWRGNVLEITLTKSKDAFSFFNSIFIGDHISESEKVTIYKHELIHIGQKHSWDLIYLELLKIVLWFNPFIYLYQNRIMAVHEFIADAKVLKSQGKTNYYQSILNQVFETQNISFTNSFYKKSLLKKRIAMLQKTKSNKKQLFKYGVLIPLVLIMLTYTSIEVRAQQKETTIVSTEDQELTDEELIEKYHEDILKLLEEENGFLKATEYAMLNPEKYIANKKAYLKFLAFMGYLADSGLDSKLKNGTLTKDDRKRFEKMKKRTRESYKQYLQWKQTQKAKDSWENNTEDRLLKLVVNDMTNLTNTENKRLKTYIKQLNTDPYFKALIYTDGKTTAKIESEIYFERIQEILETDTEVPFSVIDKVPYPKNCEQLYTNTDRKSCMSDFINKHVAENFNTDLGNSLKTGGVKRIFVQFKVGTDGKVRHIKARGPSTLLEEEAKRVIAMLPYFIPGEHKGEKVVMPFSLPIAFKVENNHYEQNLKQIDSLQKAYLNELKAIKQTNK